MKTQIWRKMILSGTLALTLSACSTATLMTQEVSVGTMAEDILSKYGAPEKVQHILKFEVWSYGLQSNQRCQIFLKNNAVAEPAKCFPNEPTRRLTSLSQR